MRPATQTLTTTREADNKENKGSSIIEIVCPFIHDFYSYTVEFVDVVL